MFKNIKRLLKNNNKAEKTATIGLTEGQEKYTPAEFLPALMSQNNYTETPQPLETGGLMQYIDINCVQDTERGESLSVRMMPDIPLNLDYLIVRIKCTPKQLRTSGLDFKIWLPH